MGPLWTIGHSTRSEVEFFDLLRAHEIRRIVDVRAFPGSRRHPHFARDALSASLPAAGVDYVWEGKTLGGRRKPAPDSPNHSLRDEGFRGYADHMATAEFREGVDRLLALASESRTAILCAEAVWWRCHRGLIADHLVLVRGVEVRHVLDASPAKPHVPRPEARLAGDHLVYDAATLY
jgi:uncharacterized protein (DUF488 family)